MDNACDLNWLVVMSTGRAGSTTILQMLNAIPMIKLTGELKDWRTQDRVLSSLFSALKTSRNIGSFGGYSMHAEPQTAKLEHHICGWLRDMMPSGPSRHWQGFKELYASGNADAELPLRATKLFRQSRLRVVRNYRKDYSQQARSGFHLRSGGGHSADLLNRTTSEMLSRTRHFQHFDMPLEAFSVGLFNQLLSFLGISNCSYTRVLAANSASSYTRDLNSSGLLTGRCVCAACIRELKPQPHLSIPHSRTAPHRTTLTNL